MLYRHLSFLAYFDNPAKLMSLDLVRFPVGLVKPKSEAGQFGALVLHRLNKFEFSMNASSKRLPKCTFLLQLRKALRRAEVQPGSPALVEFGNTGFCPFLTGLACDHGADTKNGEGVIFFSTSYVLFALSKFERCS